MPAGAIQIGGAYFEISADSAGLIQALARAEAQSKASVSAIAQATGLAEKDVARYASTLIREHNRAAEAATRDAERIAAAQRKAAAASQQAGASFVDLSKGAIGFAAAAGGVALGAAAIHQGLSKVIDATLSADRATRQLGAVFGTTSGAYQKFADDLAKSTGRVNAEVQQGVARIGALQQSYGLSQAEIEALSKASLNLAAVFGGDVQEAFRSVQAAVRGEAEASEKYTIFLQDSAIKAWDGLTAAQKRNWESMSEVTKARLRAQYALEQAAKYEGEAEKRAESQRGSFDKLARAVDQFAKTIGDQLIPVLSDAADDLTETTNAIDEWIITNKEFLEILQIVRKNMREGGIAGPTLNDINAITEALKRRNALMAGLSPETQAGLAAAYPRGFVEGAAEDNARREADTRRKREREERRDDVKRQLGEMEEALDRQVKLEIAAIEAEKKAKDRWYDEERDRLEARRHYILEDIEERRDAAIKALEAEAKAEEQRFEEAIEQAERRKQAELDAVDEAHDQAVKAIEAQQDANERARELEDRDREDARRAEDQELADTRAREDAEVEAARQRLDEIRELEDRDRQDRREAEDRDRQERREAEDRDRQERREAEDRERQDRRDAEDREIAEAREREDRDLEARAQARARRREEEDRARADAREREDREIADRREQEDREAEAAHEAALARITAEHEQRMAAYDASIGRIRQRAEEESRALDDQAEQARAAADLAERAREAAHKAALADLDEQADAARRAHDDEMRRLDRAKRAEDDRHRQTLRDLEDEKDARLAAIDAELGLLDATDDAEARAARDRQLQDAVTNARLGVQRAINTGNYSEILRARQELAEAEDAIRREGVERERDARREALRAQQEAITQEIAAKRQQADDEHRLREQGLAEEQQTARDGLAAELEAIGRRRDELRAAYDEERDLARDALDARLDEIARRREALADETDAAIAELQEREAAEQTSHEEAVGRINAEYELARQRRDETRTAEDRAREDRRLAEDRDREDRRAREDIQLEQQKRRLDDRRSAEDRDRDERRVKEDRERQDRRLADDQALAARRLAEDQALAERRLSEDRDRADRRTAEDLQAQEAATRRQHQRLDEDRLIAERRTAEDRDREDRRRDEDLALSAQLAAAEATRELDRKQVEAHFNGPNGVITQLKQAMEDAKEAHRLRLEDAGRKYEAERKEAERIFRTPEKTGLLDLLEKAREDEFNKLDQSKTDWENWRKKVQGEIKDARTDLDAFIKRLEDLGWKGGFVPVPGGENPPPQVRPPTEGSGGGGVPAPWKVSFPFDAPYNGPYPGGAAWPGGPPRHRGVDLILPGPNNGRGTTYGAFRGGQVVAAGPMSYPSGNGVILKAADGLYDVYFHNDAVKVKAGDTVQPGQPIAVLGGQGTEEFPHVHYEVRRNSGGDPIGSTIDPTPYMTGGAVGGVGGQELEVTIFGRTFKITVPAGQVGDARGDALLGAIEELAARLGGNHEFARAATAVAASETIGGTHLEQINGPGRGPFQFDPSGELAHYARDRGLSLAEAGRLAVSRPLDAAAWALSGGDGAFSGRGYLGSAIKAGLREGAQGAALAEYASRVAQRPAGENWREAGVWHRRLYGYGDGGWLREPIVGLGMVTGRGYAFRERGEDELVIPKSALAGSRMAGSPAFALPDAAGHYRAESEMLVAASTPPAAPRERQRISVFAGRHVLADMWVEGRDLAIDTGRYSERSRTRTGGR